jgi:hypothetical protein
MSTEHEILDGVTASPVTPKFVIEPISFDEFDSATRKTKYGEIIDKVVEAAQNGDAIRVALQTEDDAKAAYLSVRAWAKKEEKKLQVKRIGNVLLLKLVN